MESAPGGITAPEGFLASGISCGIKRRGRDMALIFSAHPCVVAGMFTTNSIQAPSILWAKRVLKRGTAQAILAVSGNANCLTGRRGIQDNETVAQQVSRALGIDASSVLTASTGVIGRPLPMGKIRTGIDRAVRSLTRTGSHAAALAIVTTDTCPKEFAVRFGASRRSITVGGIAKGAGMVSPRMATMLSFLTTDACVDQRTLQQVLREATAESFNAITIDGQTSTNDMVLFLANGSSGLTPIRRGTPSFRAFLKAVKAVCRFLAHEMVADGEGVTRRMTVTVSGASSVKQADRVARSVADSLLVKTMVTGRDPNWGRVAQAVGACGVPIRPNRLSIRLGKVPVFSGGEPTRVSREKLLIEMDGPEVSIGVDLGGGSSEASVTGGDLTEGYVRINAKYTT